MENNIIINLAFNIENPLHDEVIAVSCEIKKKYPSDFWVDDKRYFIHLPMYLFAAPKENKDKIIDAAKKISDQFYAIPIISKGLVTSSSGLLMVDFKKNKKLYDYHLRVLEVFNPLREGEIRNKYKDKEYFGTLSKRDKRIMKEYGHLYIFEKFHPHITISRIRDAKILKKVQAEYKDRFKNRRTKLATFQVIHDIYGEDDKSEILYKKYL